MPFDRPSSITARLAQPMWLALAVLMAWFLLESLIYRSGLYTRYLAEPHSNAGSTMLRPLLAKRWATQTPPTVLAFGNSIVGQGFSPATASTVEPKLNFINVAVPGSSPRTWFYLLRKIQRDGTPFDAVAVGITYRRESTGRWADWPLDPAFMVPLTDLRDAFEFPASFESADSRRAAYNTLWLPALQMQKDTQALLSSPRQRWNNLQVTKTWWLENIGKYTGRGGTMPVLAFDAQRRVLDWGDATPEQRALVEQHLQDLAQTPDPGHDAFLAHWMGKVLERTRANHARLIIYPLPRGPYPQVLPEENELPHSLAALAHEPDVTVLPPDFLADLEAPEYFFDTLHGNVAANRIFSERVAHAVADAMAGGASREATPP